MLIVVLGVAVAIGVPVTIGEGVSVLLAGCVPALVLATVFRGAPPRTIGQALFELDYATGGSTLPRTPQAGTPRQRD